MKIPSDVRTFAAVGQDVVAVLQRIGHNTWDCLLVDVEGNWTRAVFPSKEAAEDACRELGVPFQEGWEDVRPVQRMARRDHWGRGGGQRRAR